MNDHASRYLDPQPKKRKENTKELSKSGTKLINTAVPSMAQINQRASSSKATLVMLRLLIIRAPKKGDPPTLSLEECNIHPQLPLEAQLPIYWVPVLGSLYKLILSITPEPTIWVPGLLGFHSIVHVLFHLLLHYGALFPSHSGLLFRSLI